MARSGKPPASRIGVGAEATGRLTGNGRIDVCGVLRGEVDWDGTIAIGPEATAEIRGRASRIELHGVLKGDVEAAEAFLSRQASWSGRGQVAAMTSEDGARVEGEFRIGPAATFPAAPEPSRDATES